MLGGYSSVKKFITDHNNKQKLIFCVQLAIMVNNRVPSVFSKTYVTPRRPFEKARLDQELKIIGEYGLRNKREVWRVKYTLARIRKAARELLTLEEKDPKRLFEGNALLRRLVRIGVLEEKQMKLDYVLGLKIEDFLERRLQTQVFKAGLAKSIHHARILIRQRHIRFVNFTMIKASIRIRKCYKPKSLTAGSSCSLLHTG